MSTDLDRMLLHAGCPQLGSSSSWVGDTGTTSSGFPAGVGLLMKHESMLAARSRFRSGTVRNRSRTADGSAASLTANASCRSNFGDVIDRRRLPCKYSSGGVSSNVSGLLSHPTTDSDGVSSVVLPSAMAKRTDGDTRSSWRSASTVTVIWQLRSSSSSMSSLADVDVNDL